MVWRGARLAGEMDGEEGGVEGWLRGAAVKGILLMMLAGAAGWTPPENRYGEAMKAVDNATSCFAATDERAERLRDSLKSLEQQAADLGLRAEIERQRRLVIGDYMSSLRVRCYGGPDQATHEARKKLEALRQFITERREAHGGVRQP